MIHDRPLPPTCHSTRPLKPDGILLHYISARNTVPADPYNPNACFQIFVDNKVSAHFMVLRNGDIWRLVAEGLQAWHAGLSRFDGGSGLNATFFGIEFIGDGEHDFTVAQYSEGAFLVKDLMTRYQIPTNRIKGHEQVAGRDVRQDFKRDPGPRFDWLLFGSMVHPRGHV